MRINLLLVLAFFILVAACSRESQPTHQLRCAFTEGIEKGITYNYSFENGGSGLTLTIKEASGAVKKEERWEWSKSEEQFRNNQITLYPEKALDKFAKRFFTFKYDPAKGTISNQYPEVPAQGKCDSFN